MKSPVALTLDEITRLLTTTREHDVRAYVLFLLAISHGLRVSEAINLKRQDFTDFDTLIWPPSIL